MKSSLWPASVLLLAMLVGCSDTPFYASCESHSDCVEEADACFIIDWIDGRGLMCSRYCVDDDDCPGDARCYELVGDPSPNRVCYQRCISDLDCAPDFVCVDSQAGTMDRDDVCLPQ